MLIKDYHYPGQEFRKPMDEALNNHKKEIESNSKNVAALVGIAESAIVLWCYGYISKKDAYADAKPAIEKALKLDENYGPARTINGVMEFSDWNWDKAKMELEKGLELGPVNFGSYHWYGLYLAVMGNFEEAKKQSSIASEINTSPAAKIGLGSIYYFAHEFEAQKELLEKALKEDNTSAPLYDWLGMAYIQLGEFEKSLKVYEKAAELSDRNSEIVGGLGHAYGIAGEYDKARKVLKEMLDHLENCYVPPVQIAFVYAGLGENEKALNMLDLAYEQQSWEIAFMRTEPWFDNFHDHPRFKALLDKVGFPK